MLITLKKYDSGECESLMNYQESCGRIAHYIYCGKWDLI